MAGRCGKGARLRTAEIDDEVRHRGAPPGPRPWRPSSAPSPCWPAACTSPAIPARRRSRSTIDVSLDQHADLAADLRPQHQRRRRPSRRPARPLRAHGRQPVDGVQLGEQRLERRQRLVLPERRPAVVVEHAGRGGASRRSTQAKDAGAAAIVTIPIVDYVAADKNGGCDVRNSGPNYLQTRFKQNKPTKGSALSLTPNATDGFVYEDEFVNWLKQTSARRQHRLLARQRARPLVVDARRGASRAPSPTPSWSSATSTTPRPSSASGRRPRSTGPVNYGFYGFETLQNAPDAGQGQLPRLLPRRR